MKTHRNMLSDTRFEQTENHFIECLTILHESLLHKANYYGQKNIKKTIFLLNNFNLVQQRLKEHYFQIKGDLFETEPLVEAYLSLYDDILPRPGFWLRSFDCDSLHNPNEVYVRVAMNRVKRQRWFWNASNQTFSI